MRFDKTGEEQAGDKSMETSLEEHVEDNKLEDDGGPENHKTDEQLEPAQVAKKDKGMSIFSDEESDEKEKVEEKMEEKVEEKMEEKVEEKVEEKMEEKVGKRWRKRWKME